MALCVDNRPIVWQSFILNHVYKLTVISINYCQCGVFLSIHLCGLSHEQLVEIKDRGIFVKPSYKKNHSMRITY